MSSLIALAFAIVANPAAPAERPTMLIIGSLHLTSNNRDLVNARIEDVTTPDRQREIEALVDSLARVKPTRVAIEWKADDQTGLDRRYADYRTGRLHITANERDHVAPRLAARLDFERIDAIDWNDNPPGLEGSDSFRDGQSAMAKPGR